MISISAAFCFSFTLSSLILKLALPCIYSIRFVFAADLNDNSASLEHGIIKISGKLSFNFSRFSNAPGLSILFAAINIGFVMCLNPLEKFATSSFVHFVGVKGSNFNFIKTSLTSSSVTFNPENCLAISFAKFNFVDCIVLVNFAHTFSKILWYHLSNSPSSIFTSFIGSPTPSFPSASVVPEISTICINISACLRLSKNLFPNPFPVLAPSTKPATSINSTGTNLVTPVQNPVLGLHLTFNSLHRASTLT